MAISLVDLEAFSHTDGYGNRWKWRIVKAEEWAKLNNLHLWQRGPAGQIIIEALESSRNIPISIAEIEKANSYLRTPIGHWQVFNFVNSRISKRTELGLRLRSLKFSEVQCLVLLEQISSSTPSPAG